jgi:hypothetical protein
LVLLLALRFFAPGEAAPRLWNDVRLDGDAVQNLAPGNFDSEQAISRLASALQAAQLQQAKSADGYELTPGCSLRAERSALGEAEVARLLNSKTVELVGEQIRINTPGTGSLRYVDFLVRGKETGILRIIEVKTGGATRDAAQLAKDALIADPLAPTTFSGRAARAAGFPNGTPTGPIRTFEVNASNLKH